MSAPRARPSWWVALVAATGLGAACTHPAIAEQPSTADREHAMRTTLLEQAATLTVEDYDPARVVRAVNALHVLGKERALDEVASWQRGHRDAQGLFWVLRVLFDLPAGQAFPPVRIGQPNLPPPADPAALPRFPILIVRDTPFLVVAGYDLGGLPEAVDAHVAFFRAHGVLRDRPLAPPGSPAGLEQEARQHLAAAYGSVQVDEALRAVRPQLAKLGG